jgi:O-6-methylguanine DNA methyltransferase
MMITKWNLTGEESMRNSIDKQAVYEYLRQIPQGKVVTYGQIAEYLGNKKLARAIGNILHVNPDGEKYPCYKVVNSKGLLSKQYAFGGLEVQRMKLEADGIIVAGEKIDLLRYQWKG